MSMILITISVVSVLALIGSYLLTGLLRKYAVKNNLLDIPNKRSSHIMATPRGGGAAIVISFMVGLVVLFGVGQLSLQVFAALLGAGVFVALVGFIDDHRHIPPQWRILVHSGAAVWVLLWLDSLPQITVFDNIIVPVFLIYLVAALVLVWLLNLYNFMDGIDGIAASEAIFVAFSGFIFAFISEHTGMKLVSLLLIGSTLGFLIWNWPPAKIFMGDVGSGFLGITLGIYAYWAVSEDVVSIWTWLIVFGVFLVDATFTLLRRFLQGLPWYKAHRSHAYQHAARRWGHLRVTVSVNLINILWLLPIAYFSNTYPQWGPYLVLLALSPPLVLVFLLGAGREEKESPVLDS